MAVLAAARHALEFRLRGVGERLVETAGHEDDVERVHQLRVSTRRAAAALRIFERWLTPRVHERVRKWLRKVRRAAAPARDCDVFLQDIAARHDAAPSRQRAGLDLLLGLGHGQRMLAQQTLVADLRKPSLRFEDILVEALEALRTPEEDDTPATLRYLAVPMLAELVRELEEAVGGDLEDYNHLHRVRILGKRLRYAMEMFESCFERSFHEEHYPAVEEMQEILGQANDSHVAMGRLEAIRARIQASQPERWKRYRPGIDALVKHHQKNLPQQRAKFLHWWDAWQRTGGEAAFKKLLKQEEKE
jgi:CHAD domain-containing protein